VNNMEILNLISVIHRQVASSIALIQKLRETAQQNGATKEQLQAIDVRLSDVIARREAELGALPASSQPNSQQP
jgi:hypothetical protein